jgi:hypothetical protein
VTCIEQLFPTGVVITSTLSVVLAHAMLVAEKVGTKLVFPGTLHATWPSAVGLDPEMKVQVLPGVHGRGPVTGKVLPASLKMQVGTTVLHSAEVEETCKGIQMETRGIRLRSMAYGLSTP